ncbi:hypothetical protein V0288_19715 [Pannus brasiliensis CCIBt3594]|uniref:Uncharacterized protein n=1 Tax=Pannus brasiliensis CCIBt3594 TaxID=1427578 RepID=A0AAW9R0X5_9CHRO
MVRLTIDSQKDAYPLDPAKLEALQSGRNSTRLDPGTYRICIQSGEFRYGSTGNRSFPPEPWVILRIYGGKVINRQTGKAVGCTWSSLNGYSDILTLQVLEPACISAIFFDTRTRNNWGLVRVSIERIP